MTATLGYALMVLGALCGYLVWSTSGKLPHSIFLAIAVPLTVLGVIRMFVADELPEDVLKTVMLLGVIVALGAVVYLNRGKN